MAFLRNMSFLLLATLFVASCAFDVEKEWCTSTRYCPDGTHCCSDKLHCCPVGRNCCLGDQYCCASDLSSVVNASFVTAAHDMTGSPQPDRLSGGYKPEYSNNPQGKQVDVEKDWCTSTRYCPDGSHCCSDKLHCCPLGRNCCLGDKYCCASDLSSVVNASIGTHYSESLSHSAGPYRLRENQHRALEERVEVEKEWCTSTTYCPDGYHCCWNNLYCCSYYDRSLNYGQFMPSLIKPYQQVDNYKMEELKPTVPSMKFGDRRVQIVANDYQYKKPTPDFLRRIFPRTYNARVNDVLNLRLDENPVIIVQYVP